MLTTTALLSLKAGQLVAVGACMGFGFWMSRKLTNKLDEVLLKYDKKEMERLADPLHA